MVYSGVIRDHIGNFSDFEYQKGVEYVVYISGQNKLSTQSKPFIINEEQCPDCEFPLTLSENYKPFKPLQLNIWPNEVPGQEPGVVREIKIRQGRQKTVIFKVTEPRITVYHPQKRNANRPAVVICHGGAFNVVGFVHLGTQPYQWFNSLGFTAVVLDYRVPFGDIHGAHRNPLKDAQRTISLIRYHSEEWNINPDCVGIWGGSAGGTVAATASAVTERTYLAQDEVDEFDCMPDFQMLICPGWMVNKRDTQDMYSYLNVTNETPPAFIVNSHTENAVPAVESFPYYLKLHQLKIPAELHIYTHGGHSFGIGTNDYALNSWNIAAEKWLREMKFILS